jgi:hypothetical protein
VAGEVIEFADSKGLIIKELNAEKANRKEFEKFVAKQHPAFIFLNGHGSDESIMGHNGEVLIRAGENEEILANSVVYALACDSAAKLGFSCVRNGTLAYIGYENKFAFLTDKNQECRPEEDKLANIFKEASNEIPLSLLKGKNAQHAYEGSQRKHMEMIRKFGTSEALLEWKELRFWLFWNMKFQRMQGDGQATITGR